jgi:hypothetical protein
VRARTTFMRLFCCCGVGAGECVGGKKIASLARDTIILMGLISVRCALMGGARLGARARRTTTHWEAALFYIGYSPAHLHDHVLWCLVCDM